MASSSASPLLGDFDGEGHSDIAIWDARRARALLDANGDGRLEGITPALGLNIDVPVMGDWDGDGVETLALYRKSSNQVIYCDRNSTGACSARSVAEIGSGGGIPIRGDWNGDGKDGFAIYDVTAFTFYFYQDMTAASFARDKYGNPDDLPVSGDWNNDGKDGYGVYRPSDRKFYLTNAIGTAASTATTDAGNPGDLPVAGRWHGRTNWSVGLFRPSTRQFFLYDDPNLAAMQTVTWLDPTSVVATSGRQEFYKNGAPHTDSSGAKRFTFDPTQSFLPIAVFYIETDTTEAAGNRFQQLKNSGFNSAILWPLFLELDSALAKVPTNFKLIPNLSHFTPFYDARSKIYAWFVYDEPHDAYKATLEKLYYSHSQHAQRPLFHTNLFPSTSGPRCNRDDNRDDLWGAMAALGDATSVGCYPIHRSADPTVSFESIADAVTALRTSTPIDRPLWFVAQAFENLDSLPHQEKFIMPTPIQYRTAVYTAFVHGATGLISFGRDGFVLRNGGNLGITPAPATSYPDCPNCLVATPQMRTRSRILWNSIAGLNSELITMKPALLSPTKADPYTVDLLQPPSSGTSPIRTLLKSSPNGTYLIAVNMTNDNLEAVIQLTTNVTSAAVKFESRTVATPLSAIRDAFGPFAVHVYKF